MGLDQYLYATNYLSGGTWQKEEKQTAFAKVAEALEVDKFIYEDLPSISLNVKVGYWRKANQIHDWFVRNVQDGEDNCAEYFVSRDQLQELLQTCKDVQASKDKAVAEDLLPTQKGFFFGSYEIDEWYWEQIDYTVTQLEKVLNGVPDGWDFAYQSSW